MTPRKFRCRLNWCEWDGLSQGFALMAVGVFSIDPPVPFSIGKVRYMVLYSEFVVREQRSKNEITYNSSVLNKLING